jgi:hypothetical protein
LVELFARGQTIRPQGTPRWRLTLGNVLPALHRILGAIPQRFREELARAPRGRRLRHSRRLLTRWCKTALGHREDAAVKFELNAKKPGQIEPYEANIRALRAYQPGKLRAPLMLFRAETQPQKLSDLAMGFMLGWGELAEGGVQVRVVPGDHSTMMTEPLVRHLAKALSDELDAAQAVPPDGVRVPGELVVTGKKGKWLRVNEAGRPLPTVLLPPMTRVGRPPIPPT